MRRYFSRREAESGALAALVAIIILHLVLLCPTYPDNIVPRFFYYLPIELPVVALLLVLPRGGLARQLRIALVLALTAFTVLKIANFVAFLVFARPFNLVIDPSLVPIAVETLSKTSILLVALAVLGSLGLIGAVAALFVWTTNTLAATRYRRAMIAGSAALLIIGAGLKLTPFENRVAHDSLIFVEWQSGIVIRSIAANAQFKRDVAADPFRDIPGDRLLTGLKGNDVLLIFVEAYGRAALDDPDGAPARELMRSEAALRAAGYAMRSTWMLSPTFGGASWLAHGTFVSGLWIEDHQRYNALFVSDYKTLIHDFGRAGWRTVAVMPLFTRPWPEGKFFNYDAIYTAGDLGYAGPSFGYITMPDQYVLSTFHRREMSAADRRPVMVEMALNSSHLPWTPRPHFIPWDDVGDGSVFASEREGSEVDIDWLDAEKMKDNYFKAITYTIKTVFSYPATHIKEPALVIIVGDHQPISMVAGASASHEVPIHILSRDPALLASFEGWADGLMPSAQSPVWKMDAMRGHILKAFSELP